MSAVRFLVWTISLLFSFSSMAQSSGVHGTFRVVKGDVTIVSADGKSKKARVGQKIFPLEKVVTGIDSRAKIVMIDDNVLDISPASQIVVQKYVFEPEKDKKDVLLNVIYGKVRSKVNQKYDGANNNFKVKTPSAVAGVRGTDFFTSYNSTTKASSVVTFEGEVMYGMPGPNGSIKNAVSVRAGQTASNSIGKPPTPPRMVPKTQLTNMDKGSDSENDSSPRQPAEEGQGPAAKESKEKEPSDDGAAAVKPDDSAKDDSNVKEADSPTPEAKKDARTPSSVPATGAAPSSNGGSMLITGDVIGSGGANSFPEGNFLGGDFPDMNGVSTDASRAVDSNLNPCVGNCSDIIRNVIESGNSKVIINIRNIGP